MRRRVHPAFWFAELCEVADVGREARREAAQGAKADKPKGTSRVIDYRIRKHSAELSLLPRRMPIGHDLRSLCRARMLAWRLEREMPTWRAEPT